MTFESAAVWNPVHLEWPPYNQFVQSVNTTRTTIPGGDMSDAEKYEHQHPGIVSIEDSAGETVTVAPTGDGRAEITTGAAPQLNKMQVHVLKQALDRAANYRAQ